MSASTITAILTILSGIISLVVYLWQKSDARKKAEAAEVVRGEAAEKAAKELAQKSNPEVNTSIQSQNETREKSDF